MPTDETQPYDPSDRLDEALREYEEAREQGQPLDRAEFLARNADIADQLGPLIDAVERIERVAGPFRDSLAGKPPPLPVTAPHGYVIIEEISRGGMGVVYKARKTDLEAFVALKLLHPDYLARLEEPTRREAIEQFRTEARFAARLQHPNRVHILHLGEHEGLPYYAMELIEGCSLADKLKRGEVTTEKVVKYLTSIAEAVQDAHDHGILHRDIKPGNILIDERTEEAMLADFGLAMIAPTGAGPAEQSVREQARVAGTLPYMSPEQTRDADLVTVRSDVYSLGATLYETLTRTAPFTGNSRKELLDKIRNQEPIPPHQLAPRVPRLLGLICVRCLNKAPENRYASARELAEALRGWKARLRYLLLFTKTYATLLLAMAPVGLVIHLLVWWMLQGSVREPVIWLLVSAHYLTICPGLLLDIRYSGQQGHPHWRERVAVSGGHAVAFTLSAVALRTELAVPARDVILLMYPILAALSGLVYFIEASRMPWKMAWGPIGFWLVGVVMLFHREAAPIYYGVYVALASVAYGLYLRKLGKQLG